MGGVGATPCHDAFGLRHSTQGRCSIRMLVNAHATVVGKRLFGCAYAYVVELLDRNSGQIGRPLSFICGVQVAGIWVERMLELELLELGHLITSFARSKYSEGGCCAGFYLPPVVALKDGEAVFKQTFSEHRPTYVALRRSRVGRCWMQGPLLSLRSSYLNRPFSNHDVNLGVPSTRGQAI